MVEGLSVTSSESTNLHRRQEQEDSPDHRTTPCIVCKERIPFGAQVCTHCKSWQDWSRYLVRWRLPVATVLAMLPLWTGAISLYNIAFRRAADVKILAVSCELATVSLAITNSGGHPGILGRSSVSLQVNGAVVGKPILLKASKEQAIVRPQETFVLNLRPLIEDVPTSIPVPISAKACSYRVVTTVREFQGSSHELTTSCSCPGFDGAL